MSSRSLTHTRRRDELIRQLPPSSFRSIKTLPPDRHSGIVRRPGGFTTVPRRLNSAPSIGGSTSRLTKLLLNVTIERSLGPVQLVMPHENTIRDLIKAALDVYDREKRRPLLPATDPHRFELHYSQFSLESLRPEEKLMNLGSRNFFLCSKPISTTSAGSSCSEEAKKATDITFPLTKLMDFLL